MKNSRTEEVEIREADTLLLDADSIIYAVCYVATKQIDKYLESGDFEHEDSINNMGISYANRAADCKIGYIMKRCHHRKCEVYISSLEKSNFRFDVAKTRPYKSNRPMEKPKYFEAVRQHLIHKYDAIVVDNEEPDDVMCYRAHELAKEDKSYIVAGVDKDLDQIPGVHYHFNNHFYYEVTEDEADYNFYYQMLVGDSVDAIPGAKGIGKIKARRILSSCRNSKERLMACLAAFNGDTIKMNEMAQLVRLRTHREEMWDVKDHMEC